GNDVMNGDNGNDRMFGDNGDDAVWGGRHHDHIWGGRGYDMLDVHPAADETGESPASCNPLDPPSPAAWYAFGFDSGATCDGNLEQVDFIYGGWDADQMQANVGENGNAIGDRLFDWVGNYNLFIVCPSSYGERIITRSHSPSIAEFLHRLAEGDGAYMPGPDAYDPSGFNEIGFVHRGDMRYNNNPVYPGTPAHKNCTADSTVASPPPEPVEELAQGFTSTLSSVTLTAGYIHVEGSIDAAPNTDILVDFVLPSQCQEGIVESQAILGSTALQTDLSGNAGIDEQWAIDASPFVALAATFTDLGDPQESTWSCVAFDRDEDSVPDIADNCPRWPNPSQGEPPWPIAASDPDCDGVGSAREEMMGTVVDEHCAATAVPNDEHGADAWPFDFNDDQRANLADVVRFGGVYNSVDGDERFQGRHDFNADGRVSLSDVILFGPMYNRTCG
ncbi:MAG: thrombospondin type 3 repeat-containing protein, partial [Dehalococcoidia bacterium]